MRYRFYREHKYISFALNELERLVARTDFRVDAEVFGVKEKFEWLTFLLQGHARYEDDRLHTLLTNKGSTIHETIEAEHCHQDDDLVALKDRLTAIGESSQSERVEAGYQFYLAYRKFVCDNLAHLHSEETIILPELHRLYSDAELRAVEFNTYAHTTPEQMVHMMEVLFPHMNASDHEAFLVDMKESEPEKFAQAWEGIKSQLAPEEQKALKSTINLT